MGGWAVTKQQCWPVCKFWVKYFTCANLFNTQKNPMWNTIIIPLYGGETGWNVVGSAKLARSPPWAVVFCLSVWLRVLSSHLISHCPKGPCWKETGQWLQERGLECQERSAHVSGGLSFSESNRKDVRTPLSKVPPGIQVILSSPYPGLPFPWEEFKVQVQAVIRAE